jgi:transposase
MRVQVNKLDFTGQNIYVGIDVHLKSWSVAVLSEGAVLKKFTQSPSPEALYKFLVVNYPGASYHSVYEAGFSGFWTHYALLQLGVNNIVVNPSDVPTMLKEKLRKSDAVDCNKLARSLRSGELKGIYIPSQENFELRSLTRLRKTITLDIAREKNRIKGLLYLNGITYPENFSHSYTHWSRRFIAWLQTLNTDCEHFRKTLDFHINTLLYHRKSLLEYTRDMRKITRSENFARQMDLITSVPGIGVTIGMTILTEIQDVSRFKNSDSLASYIGLTPMCYSSGEKENSGDITIRKHSSLRCYLVEAAWKAVRFDPAMTLAYQNYRVRGLHPNKAIIKIARKLSNRIFYVLKHQKKYVSNIVQ